MKQGTDPFRLEFLSLHPAGLAYAFPCDAQGRVDLDALCESVRNDYFFARMAVGREFARPRVSACEACRSSDLHQGRRDDCRVKHF